MLTPDPSDTRSKYRYDVFRHPVGHEPAPAVIRSSSTPSRTVAAALSPPPRPVCSVPFSTATDGERGDLNPRPDGDLVKPVAFQARALTALCALCCLLALAPAVASADTLPDPVAPGTHPVTTLDPFLAGSVNLQESNSAGGAPGAESSHSSAAATIGIRGSLYMPSDLTAPAPLVLLVHGNHGSCDAVLADGTSISPSPTAVAAGDTTPNLQCSSGGKSYFKRNDRGYAYLGQNLASNGYIVVSLDQDQLMMLQDSNMGKGMHQRRLLIAAMLDALYKANATGIPAAPDATLGTTLLNKIDFDRGVGLMGHSRGGDAVTSFIDYNRTRPEPGRRYNLAGVISLAPVDYERRAPYGMPYMTVLPMCDGDVSNLQGARFFERSQYIDMTDPYPRIQVALQGANHNFFNSVWSADNDDQTATDTACGPYAASQATSIRLSGGTTIGTPTSSTKASFLGTYTFANRGDGDPALMGDQEKAGLAIMAAFFREYVGGETGFDPYMTGELSATANHQQLPDSACPTSVSGTRMPCDQRVSTSYFAAPAERMDVIRPEADNPLTVSALGTALKGSGFVNPYLDGGGISPKPATTTGGYDWCNPEPTQFAPAQLGLTGLPTATKGCPLPAATALGGQNGTRENSPINQSYGLQLALAWDRGVTDTVAKIGTNIPAASGDVSKMKALAMGAGVNFFDPRNPDRSGDATWNPALAAQHFTIALTDADGVTGAVDAGDRRYGNALEQTLGSTTAKVHVILNQIRVPLADFAAKGVDLTKVRRIELRFGEIGKPGSGSIELADVRFQETADAVAKADAAAPTPTTVPTAARATASAALPDAIGINGATTTPATAKGCLDTAAPTAAIASLKATRGALALAGTASDKAAGCKASGVASVQVTVTKAAAGGKCRFVVTSGTLTKPIACSTGFALVAKGKTAWKLAAARKLPKGRYRVTVKALDAAGNATTLRRALTVR
jgi:hypothetical protein